MRPKSPYVEEVYQRNARIYKLLASAKRLEILNTIRRREATVSQLAEGLSMRKANVSQHLAVLRHAGLVRTRREGQNIYYVIADSRLIEPCAILKRLHEQGRIR